MPPTSQTTNAHRSLFPSIIRTRSQQQHIPSQVDLSASPLREAIRSHNHNHNTHPSPHTWLNQHSKDNARPRTVENGVLLSPSRTKRASSPSFAENDQPGKRVRVFGKSQPVNPLSDQKPDGSVGTSWKEVPNSLTPLKRAVSSRSPGDEIVSLDLTKVPQSPSKSPSKRFHITAIGGRRMDVPLTPGKNTGNSPGKAQAPTFGALSKAHPISEFGVHLDGSSLSSSPTRTSAKKSTPTQQSTTLPARNTSQGSHLDVAIDDRSSSATCLPSISSKLQSTPTTTRCLRESPCKRLLLATVPLTPHHVGGALPGQPPFSQSTSDEGTKPEELLLPPASSGSLEATRTGQSSPTKSRIPVPTGGTISRLARPSSSMSLPVTGPTSPKKSPHHRPLKVKPKVNRKPKAEVRSRAPLTRLAAKRGIRRSSVGTGLGVGAASSTGANTTLPTSSGPGPSNLNNTIGAVSATDKKSIVTSSSASTENSVVPRATSLLPHPTSASASPTKPTPLTALSTALQKLLATPPMAPTHRLRQDTALRDANSDTPAAFGTPQPQNNGIRIELKAPQPASTDINSKTRPSGVPNELGKMGLPMRRPALLAGAGASTLATGALFASKQTSLSTVPASPARSAAPPEGDGDMPLSSHGMQNEVLDVDAWVPSVPTGHGEAKAKEEPAILEYTVALADDARATQHPPIGLVSPSRRASQASLSLTQSLSLPRPPSSAPLKLARSASASRAMQCNPRTPVKTRGKTRPPLSEPEASKPNDPMGGKRSNARMPGSLDVLKDCVIFVDVKTEEGEDAGALFIDMLRGLGARILAKPGKSCTHLVYKDGSPVTITKYKLLPEPRPLPVSIGWVVECVENREHVDETKFLVNLDEIGVAGDSQRRRSMQPRQMRTLTLGQLENGESADISVRADTSFTSEEPSMSGPILTAFSPLGRSPNKLPPLERARQRSLHLRK